MSSRRRAQRSSRSGWLRFALLALSLVLAAHAYGQSSQVPVPVQADLLVKVAAFDRNFRARAGDRAIVLLAAMNGDASSMRAAMEMKAALARVPTIGDLPHEEQIVTYTNAVALADLTRSRRAAIVYFGPGFAAQVPALRDAFASVNVLTIGAVPEYVPAGIVLGFDLVSGRPKLLVNVPQARKQQVAFPASVLNLMKVYPEQ